MLQLIAPGAGRPIVIAVITVTTTRLDAGIGLALAPRLLLSSNNSALVTQNSPLKQTIAKHSHFVFWIPLFVLFLSLSLIHLPPSLSFQPSINRYSSGCAVASHRSPALSPFPASPVPCRPPTPTNTSTYLTLPAWTPPRRGRHCSLATSRVIPSQLRPKLA